MVGLVAVMVVGVFAIVGCGSEEEIDKLQEIYDKQIYNNRIEITRLSKILKNSYANNWENINVSRLESCAFYMLAVFELLDYPVNSNA